MKKNPGSAHGGSAAVRLPEILQLFNSILTPRAAAPGRVRPECCWSPTAPAPISSKMETTKILRELERVWEAGGLPGRQAAEQNAALCELWRLLQPTARAPAHLWLV